MQKGGPERGASSELRASLQVYLNNRKRLQPIIGLCSIVECVSVSTRGGALYLCEVCVCRLGKVDMQNHIMGSLHRYNYIRAKHPELVPDCKEDDLSLLAWPLMEAAKTLEEREGPGDIGLLEVEDAVFHEVMGNCVSDALTLIKSLKHEQMSDKAEPQRIVLPHRGDRWRSPESLHADVKPFETLARTDEHSEGGFLDGYTGSQPLIGLFRVVECRSEDGRTYCFLCHCCRTRISRGGIADHIASSSHMVNYLVETRPQEMEPMMPYEDDDTCQALHSLARDVEREEGRGELRVVNAPGFLCSLLTTKSYHWCVKMLCNAWTQSNIQLMKTAGRGPRAAKGGAPLERPVMPLKRAKRKTAKRKTRGARNPVFKVSLPLTKGSIVLQRTSFGVDEPPALPHCAPPANWGLGTSPESPVDEWDGGWTPSSQDPGYAEAEYQYKELEGNQSQAPGVDCEESFFEPTETLNQNGLGLLPPQQRQNSYDEWQSAEPWDCSYYHGDAGPSAETPTNEMQSPNQGYYQQPPCIQGRHHSIDYDSGAQPYAEYSHNNNFGAAPEPPRVQFLEIQQRQLQTYMELNSGHFQAAPHWTQAAAAPPPDPAVGPSGPKAVHQPFPGMAPGLTVSYGWAGLMVPATAAVCSNPAYGAVPY